MKRERMGRYLRSVLAALLIQSTGVAALAQTALVPDGVTSYWLSEPKVFWHTEADCPIIPSFRSRVEGGGGAADDPEVISRVYSDDPTGDPEEADYLADLHFCLVHEYAEPADATQTAADACRKLGAN